MFFQMLKEVPLLAILTRNMSSDFFLWVLVNMWEQFPKKTACYRPFKMDICKGLYGENDRPSIWRKRREKHKSNYNQIRTYVESSPNQSKKVVPYRPFHQTIDETLKIPEMCWPSLCLNFAECSSSALSAHAYKMVITTVCCIMLHVITHFFSSMLQLIIYVIPFYYPFFIFVILSYLSYLSTILIYILNPVPMYHLIFMLRLLYFFLSVLTQLN